MKKLALISVWDKTGIVDLAVQLDKLGWEIIATRGTYKILKKAKIKVIPIEKISKNPEAFNGRVKTISFQVAGAILFDRKKHLKEAKKLGFHPIDMVVCNFYPLGKSIENIDVGGPIIVRAAAKNFKNVLVLIDPKDYKRIIKILKDKREVSEKLRLQLAKKTFQKTSDYDKKICDFLKKI